MSKIEWTERTWNPVVGCHKVSPGCKHCYAEELHGRLTAMGVRGYEKPFTTVRFLPDSLDKPLKRKNPTTWFVNSMSDLFHPAVSYDALRDIFAVMHQCKQHKFQVLTKRPERARDYLWHCWEKSSDPDAAVALPEHIWLGTSVEDRKYGLPRIETLRGCPAKRRFLSCEPLLEDLGYIDLTGIDWVIVGGESGRKARPMRSEWVENIRQQCEEQGAAFFFKQWGRYGEDGKSRSKKKNGRLFKGKVWEMMPS